MVPPSWGLLYLHDMTKKALRKYEKYGTLSMFISDYYRKDTEPLYPDLEILISPIKGNKISY